MSLGWLLAALVLCESRCGFLVSRRVTPCSCEFQSAWASSWAQSPWLHLLECLVCSCYTDPRVDDLGVSGVPLHHHMQRITRLILHPASSLCRLLASLADLLLIWFFTHTDCTVRLQNDFLPLWNFPDLHWSSSRNLRPFYQFFFSNLFLLLPPLLLPR